MLHLMAWNVEHTDEFAEWYHGLSETQQDDLTAAGLLLIELVARFNQFARMLIL